MNLLIYTHHMERIRLTTEGITLRELVEAFGELREEERTIDYDNREQYELQLDTGGFVSLEEFIQISYTDEGEIESTSLSFENLPSVETAIRTHEQRKGSDEPPRVPHVDMDEIEIESRRSFYHRLKQHSDSQPATIREIIYYEGQLSRDELYQLIEEAGYEPSGGSVSASLVMLEQVTNEIERHGRGSDTTVVWTGNN
uniref:Uncharacterized protein n=1 Tax=uncultured haloarchaeon TaxID=160804 RepID=A5YS40_9EURY|nr:hypothetical protein [uncultured haloarchaeon]